MMRRLLSIVSMVEWMQSCRAFRQHSSAAAAAAACNKPSVTSGCGSKAISRRSDREKWINYNDNGWTDGRSAGRLTDWQRDCAGSWRRHTRAATERRSHYEFHAAVWRLMGLLTSQSASIRPTAADRVQQHHWPWYGVDEKGNGRGRYRVKAWNGVEK